uniref:Uncharacterized protein n=1 Tax=Timema bartmani TaxID=61472 RepID=A0A7R9F681_9NEOP|nr:unnamed protein product [Timema bartmani]
MGRDTSMRLSGELPPDCNKLDKNLIEVGPRVSAWEYRQTGFRTYGKSTPSGDLGVGATCEVKVVAGKTHRLDVVAEDKRSADLKTNQHYDQYIWDVTHISDEDSPFRAVGGCNGPIAANDRGTALVEDEQTSQCSRRRSDKKCFYTTLISRLCNYTSSRTGSTSSASRLLYGSSGPRSSLLTTTPTVPDDVIVCTTYPPMFTKRQIEWNQGLLGSWSTVLPLSYGEKQWRTQKFTLRGTSKLLFMYGFPFEHQVSWRGLPTLSVPLCKGGSRMGRMSCSSLELVSIRAELPLRCRTQQSIITDNMNITLWGWGRGEWFYPEGGGRVTQKEGATSLRVA